MKSRKTRMFVALGLLAISGFSLMTISFADEYKDIQLNPNNAIQTIPTVVFKPSLDSNDKVELQNVRGKRLIQVVTNNNNFILSKNGSSKAVNSTSSSILGGDDNVLNNSNYSTIIAGEGNQINNSSHGVIGGGSGNTVIGNYGTVAGGEGNTANAYGVAVGGKLNAANGSNSVAIGYNAKANGNNSVAMGKNATVEGNNSFLWSDGTLGDDTLASNDTFAVVGASGMVVNETKAHRFAKLTIGGSLIVRENKAVECGSETIGVLKVLNRTDATNHVCFCSCDGTKWNSLFVGGACSAKCDASFVEPQCDPTGVTKNCEGGVISYSGGCLVGNLVEGTGAFLIDNNGKLHWTCQTENGSQVQCSGNIPTKDCNDPKGHGVCTGEPENAIFVESTDIKNKPGEYDNLGPTLYNKLSDVPANAKCAWYCSGGYYMEPGFTYCHKNRPCDPQEYEGYSVPYLEDTQERDVSKPGAAVLYGTRTCTNTVVCNNKELSLKGTDVCPITCNDGFDYDEASGRCYQNGVCGDEHYTCDKGTLGTTSYSESTHSWTWTCLGINGGSDDLTCSEAEDIDGVCGSEYRTCSKGDVVSATQDESRWLWTCKGYNGGEDKPCTKSKPCVEKTCPAGVYTLSSCPWGDDYCTACTPVDAQCNNGTTVYSLNSCPCGYYKNGDSCVACGAKKYSSAGSSSCQTASVGYYANSSCSQTACTNKPDNAHYTSNASSNSCSWECNDGYSKSGNTCVADPVSCNCGYYNNNGTCTLCGAKKYSSAGASSCSTASVGYYANSSCSQTACTNKPEHSHYTSNASSNSCEWACDDGYTKSGNSCVASPVSCNCGYYNNNGTCTACGAKKYSSAGASSCSTASVGYYANSSCSQTACTNKPDNSHYTSNASSNSCEWACDDGYTKSGNSCVEDDEPLSCDCSYYNDNGTCKACAVGKYSSAGATSCSSCTNKPSNSSYTSNACTNSCSWQCNCGYYKNGSSCSACAVGKYSSAGATSCTNCTNKPSNSHYTSNACGNSCDWECDDGYTKAGTSCVKDDEPLSCDCSYYNDNGTCKACAVGKYSSAGATSCSSCTNKPSNSSYTSNACTNSCSWQCDCGYYKNGSSCTACGAKKYSSAGSTSCSTADVGYYANSSCSQTACTNKPSNSYYTSNASTNSCDWACNCGYYKNGSSCSSCGVGTYSSAGSTSCTNCSNKPSNSHYTSNACSNSCEWACDDGYHKSGNSCVQDSCNCGYYNNGGTCTACGAKKYSSAGATSCSTADVGYYANSSCSQTACTNKPSNSHYTSNASSNNCSWECDTDYKLNSAGNGCVKKKDIVCGTAKYTCTSDGSYTVNEKPSTATHYVWDCIGEDASAYDCKAEIPVAYSCQGPRPENAQIKTGTVTSNKKWEPSNNLEGYCVFKCNNGYTTTYNGQWYSCKCNSTCNDGTYLKCPSGTYTGGRAYTNTCGDGCYTCSTTQPSACGPKPRTWEYNGYSYQYNILYDGSHWYINDECTCNTSTRKWECTGYRGMVGRETGIVDNNIGVIPSSNCGRMVEDFILKDDVSDQDGTKACIHLCGSGPCERQCKSYVNCRVEWGNRVLCDSVTQLKCYTYDYVSPVAYSG